MYLHQVYKKVIDFWSTVCIGHEYFYAFPRSGAGIQINVCKRWDISHGWWHPSYIFSYLHYRYLPRISPKQGGVTGYTELIS